MDDEIKAIDREEFLGATKSTNGKNKWSEVGIRIGMKNAKRELIRYKEMLVAKAYS